MLRSCAEVNESTFPLSLSINDDAGTPLAIQKQFADTLEQQVNEGDEAQMAAAVEKVQKFAAPLGRAIAFQSSIKPENDWNYFGGAKLDDVDRPICGTRPQLTRTTKLFMPI